MRWLLFLVAVSASADCNSRLLYNTTDYITNAVIDDGALYVSLLLADDIERIDLTTGERIVVSMSGGASANWDVQHGLLVTPQTIGRTDVALIRIRDGSVYWIESGGVLRRMILGGGTAETIAEHVTQYTIFEDRVVFISDDNLFYKRLSDIEPALLLRRVDAFSSVTTDGILVERYSKGDESYSVHGEILRVSWSGAVEDVYQTNGFTYHNIFELGAQADHATTYVQVRNNYDTRLLAIRNGSSAEVYRALLIEVLAADDDSVTFLEWGGYGAATGWHHLVSLSCTSRTRNRAVR